MEECACAGRAARLPVSLVGCTVSPLHGTSTIAESSSHVSRVRRLSARVSDVRVSKRKLRVVLLATSYRIHVFFTTEIVSNARDEFSLESLEVFTPYKTAPQGLQSNYAVYVYVTHGLNQLLDVALAIPLLILSVLIPGNSFLMYLHLDCIFAYGFWSRGSSGQAGTGIPDSLTLLLGTRLRLLIIEAELALALLILLAVLVYAGHGTFCHLRLINIVTLQRIELSRCIYVRAAVFARLRC